MVAREIMFGDPLGQASPATAARPNCRAAVWLRVRATNVLSVRVTFPNELQVHRAASLGAAFDVPFLVQVIRIDEMPCRRWKCMACVSRFVASRNAKSITEGSAEVFAT